MGTDRFLIHDGSCACGRGRYIVYECEPDHPYPTKSRWTEKEITCPQCSESFALDVRGSRVIQVRKTDLAQKEELRKQWYSARHRVMEDARKHLDALESVLSEKRSDAERYRVLRPLIGDIGTESTFRRNLRGAASLRRWMENRVLPSHMARIMEFLGVRDERLLADIKEVERLFDESERLPPGEPVPPSQHTRR